MKVELLKIPSEQDLKWVKTCTLNTVGKKLKSDSQVSSEWVEKIGESRTLTYS